MRAVAAVEERAGGVCAGEPAAYPCCTAYMTAATAITTSAAHDNTTIAVNTRLLSSSAGALLRRDFRACAGAVPRGPEVPASSLFAVVSESRSDSPSRSAGGAAATAATAATV